MESNKELEKNLKIIISSLRAFLSKKDMAIFLRRLEGEIPISREILLDIALNNFEGTNGTK